MVTLPPQRKSVDKRIHEVGYSCDETTEKSQLKSHMSLKNKYLDYFFHILNFQTSKLRFKMK